MMPKNTKHAPTKGNVRPLPVLSVYDIVVVIPIGSLGNSEETKNGLHVARSNTGQSAATDARKPAPMISTAHARQDGATRLTNDGEDSKRKAYLHTGSERTTKRANKQDHPGMSYAKDNPSSDKDNKPAAKKTPPNPPTPDGALSMCPDIKVESTSTHIGSVVSTSGQGIKLEQPAPKTETASNLKCEPMTGQENMIDNAANDVKPAPMIYTTTGWKGKSLNEVNTMHVNLVYTFVALMYLQLHHMPDILSPTDPNYIRIEHFHPFKYHYAESYRPS
jgi:hypothetical protein